MSTDDPFKDAAPPPIGMTPVPPPASPFPQPVMPSVLDDARVMVGGVYDRPPVIPERTSERNWLGVASLVTGVLGGVVLSLIFGLFGLHAYRKGSANTRSLAIAGLAVSGAWILVGGALVAAVLLLDDDHIVYSQAQPGDCFSSDIAQLEDFVQDTYYFEPCSETTNGIVYFITALPSTAPYPDASTASDLLDACTTDFAVSGVDVDIAADYWVEYFVGPSDRWAQGDHTVICGLSTDGALDYAVVPDIEPHMADA